MPPETEVWKPGSFTKNFSWGNTSAGLSELHHVIRVGFDSRMEDVPRALFRERVRATGRPEYIPVNFFLFNKRINAVDYICADELVFQAVNWDQNESFDKLALFAFLLSYAGYWKGAQREQRRPALWANAYVRTRVASDFQWDTKLVSANDIENYVARDPRYVAATSRKLSTNLNHLFLCGRLREFPSKRIERWWVNCLFLALDRIIEDRLINGQPTPPSLFASLLFKNHFMELTGKVTLEKQLAVSHLVALYDACGGRDRFSDAAAAERTRTLCRDVRHFVNDPRPRGAVHESNPRILKSIPAACAMLARYAGFRDLSPDDLDQFDLEDFIRRSTQAALDGLKEENIHPTMTAEELMKLTRGQ